MKLEDYKKNRKKVATEAFKGAQKDMNAKRKSSNYVKKNFGDVIKKLSDD